MKIENRQQFLVVLTIASFALLIGVDFVFKPLSGWWSSRAEEIRQLRININEGKMLVLHETSIRDNWSKMQANTLTNNTSLAEQQLLAAIDNWSRGSGAEVTRIMPQWNNDSTNYLTLGCRVEASGGLGALSQFIYNAENGPLALRLDSVELSAHDVAGQQLTLAMQIDGLALLPQATQ